MSNCIKRGCRNLETVCEDCGRVVCKSNISYSLNWKHILASQPEQKRLIVHITYHSKDNYTMGVSNYYHVMPFKELLEILTKMEIPHPDFWWVYKEDFPFPGKEIKETQG